MSTRVKSLCAVRASAVQQKILQPQRRERRRDSWSNALGFLLAAALLILLPELAPAQTAILAYEGFDYLEGGTLADGATGTGWANAWAESGEGGDEDSELIIGPGSFAVPPGSPSPTGNHIDLNYFTGNRTIVRQLSTTLGAQAGYEYTFSFVLDVDSNGAGAGGVDYAGIELSYTGGGPVVFLGKPTGAGPANDGTLGMDVYGQGFVSTGVAADGQKLLRLRWVANGSDPELLTLTVHDVTTDAQLGSATTTTEATFNQVNLVARRDLAFGDAIPAFDELLATSAPPPTWTLTVNSTNPTSGVLVTVSPADNNSKAGGSTSFIRTYTDNTVVTLTAPTNVPDRVFKKWQRNGTDYSTNATIAVTMSTNRIVTCLYDFPLDEHFSGITPVTNGVRVTWTTVGGRSYVVQATSSLTNAFTNVSPTILVSGTGRSATNFLEPGAARLTARFYRVRIISP